VQAIGALLSFVVGLAIVLAVGSSILRTLTECRRSARS
jgi:hypothetical protein